MDGLPGFDWFHFSSDSVQGPVLCRLGRCWLTVGSSTGQQPIPGFAITLVLQNDEF